MKFQPGTQFKIDNVKQLEAAYNAHEAHFMLDLEVEKGYFAQKYKVVSWLKLINKISLTKMFSDQLETIQNPFADIQG
jgi:hypothetical protein